MLFAALLLFFLFSGTDPYSFLEILKLKCECLPYRTQFKDMACSISTSRTVDCTQFLIYDGKLKTRLEGDDGKICTISWENICGRDTTTKEFCYKVVANKKNFWDAAEDCTNQGYSLFSPHSDRQLQFFWEIVRSYSEQEFWTGAGTYRNEWIFHDGSTADFFRLNPNYDFNQPRTLALAFTSKSWSHANLGYTRVVPAADLNAYVCVRNGSSNYAIPTESETFPQDTMTTSMTTTTTTAMTISAITTVPSTTITTTTKKYCPPGGEWTDWDETPRFCDDYCGSYGTVNRTRKCLSNAWNCPCTGPAWYGSYCEPRMCKYRQSCSDGLNISRVDNAPPDYRYQCGPPPGNPPDTPKPPGYCPSHGLGIWSQWGYWGTCSATCGLCGTQRRTRTCISPSNCRCVGQSMETRFCPGSRCDKSCCRGLQVYAAGGGKFCKQSEHRCQGEWADWRPTGFWPATCGGPFIKMKRRCFPAGCQCQGTYVKAKQGKGQSKPCPPGTTPVLLPHKSQIIQE